jgi:lysozyme family protein
MTRDDAIDLILKLEGGYVNHPADPGGETKYGISKRAHPELDIANLSPDQAREIYRSDYWNPTAARIYDTAPRLAGVVFDAAVNHGNGQAVRLLQKIVQTNADGIIGPMTIAALRDTLDDVGEDELIVRYLIERAMLYVGLRQWAQFGRGWMRRLFTVALLAADNRSSAPTHVAKLLDQILNLARVARSEVR